MTTIPVAPASPFTVVSGGREWQMTKQEARFPVPIELVNQPEKLAKVVKLAVAEMIGGMSKYGYIYADKGIQVVGPLNHMEFSDSDKPDKGPEAAPNPLDRDRWEAWDKAEKENIAREFKEGLLALSPQGEVDYVIKASFLKEMKLPNIISRR